MPRPARLARGARFGLRASERGGGPRKPSLPCLRSAPAIGRRLLRRGRGNDKLLAEAALLRGQGPAFQILPLPALSASNASLIARVSSASIAQSSYIIIYAD